MKKTSYEEVLKTGKPLTMFTVGSSMQPLLYARSTLVVIRRVNGKLRRGDLPLYKDREGKYILHRIIRSDEKYYYTRGDNRYGLETVPHKWVIGVVSEIHRKEKVISVDSVGYKLYVKIWLWSYPIRYFINRVISRLKRL